MKVIGVIGLGFIGMRHAKNLLAMGHAVIAYDPDDSRIKQFLSLKGKGNWLSIERDLLIGAVKTDGIVIATPTEYHYSSISSLLCGKEPPLFVEKPIGTTVHNFMAGVRMVGYNLRFHSCVKKAKEWLDAGLIGKPLWANFTCAQYNDKPAYQRDGVILNWSHEIDLALYLLGNGSVAGSSTRLSDGRDDMTDILLTHESGCRSHIHLDYLTNPELRISSIIGTEGKIVIDLKARQALKLHNDGIEDLIVCKDSFDENYIEEMQAFLDRIDEKETIGCSGGEGLEVLKICLEVRKQAGLN